MVQYDSLYISDKMNQKTSIKIPLTCGVCYEIGYQFRRFRRYLKRKFCL